ncbi:NDMA-dependent alcohol dehydrogenase [uncultured Mycolicibacterium sp.]|jgi:oxidoreductase, Rxyl_3153 family|uniref:NDMA-dependent alcohol dehydrogenase n=1 Tax=uncultured Mycolicibacterium sp. TaxID=2320817 RepID=UPI002638577A|nr:NDMA-dependent alcohol dehydrogenase [uncultured Mycolicibacterium sp.]
MKTKAAVMWQSPGQFEIEEFELDPPKAGEILVRWDYAGLCHSDEHLRHGDYGETPPMIGGHEGTGVVMEVGPGVTTHKVGDHIVGTFMPFCGRCRFCAMGKPALCDNGKDLLSGRGIDGTYRMRGRNGGVGNFDFLGTFSQYNVIPENCALTIESSRPMAPFALLSCAGPTGWGSAVISADVQPGDVVVIYGFGGVGACAMQGAKIAGARTVVVVDPVEFKRTSALELGATHVFATAEEAHEFVWDTTWGQGADSAIVTVGLVTPPVVSAAFRIIRKAGTVVVTSMANPNTLLEIPSLELSLYEKRITGTMAGAGHPHETIRKLIRLYDSGQLKLDELVTAEYELEQVNEAYDDMLAGKNIRGVLKIEH